jgi:hypothetical protein
MTMLLAPETLSPGKEAALLLHVVMDEHDVGHSMIYIQAGVPMKCVHQAVNMISLRCGTTLVAMFMGAETCSSHAGQHMSVPQ